MFKNRKDAKNGIKDNYTLQAAMQHLTANSTTSCKTNTDHITVTCTPCRFPDHAPNKTLFSVSIHYVIHALITSA